MRLARGSKTSLVSGGRRGGHTLLEVTIAVTVLLMAVLVYSQSVTSGIRSQQSINEKSIALNAARDILERLKSEPFDDVYALYNSDDGDDPGGAGSAPGEDFGVDGLDPVAGQNFEGKVRFPENGGNLRENLNLPEFGLPYDLNADGAVDASDVSADYRLLPVVVEIEWTGASGDQTLEVSTWLADGI